MTLESQISQITESDEFTRLCNAVFTAEYPNDFQVIDGTRGDEGNDGYLASERRVLAIYCPTKPSNRTDADYLRKAFRDLSKAVKLREAGTFKIEQWTFVTPGKLANEVVGKIRVAAEEAGIKGNHLESTYLASLLLKHTHLIPEFPSLYIPQIEKRIEEVVSYVKSLGAEQKADDRIRPIGERPAGVNKEESAEALRVAQLRALGISNEAKHELKVISYRSSDHEVQLNAIFGVLDLYIPVDDKPADMIELCDRGIAIARAC